MKSLKTHYCFIIDYILKIANKIGNNKKIKILDYGCRRGDIVRALLSFSFDVYGVDVFCKTEQIELLKKLGLMNSRIFKIDNKISQYEFKHIEEKYIFYRLKKKFNNEKFQKFLDC